jgi:hypothetical protein
MFFDIVVSCSPASTVNNAGRPSVVREGHLGSSWVEHASEGRSGARGHAAGVDCRVCRPDVAVSVGIDRRIDDPLAAVRVQPEWFSHACRDGDF